MASERFTPRAHQPRVFIRRAWRSAAAASFAALADVILAEPGALIGFAGPRVIRQTIRQELPEGFQRSEFLLKHGMVDRVTDRRRLKEELVRVLRHLHPGVAYAPGV